MWNLFLVLSVLIFSAFFLGGCVPPDALPIDSMDVSEPMDVELKVAIELAGEYLVRVCGPDGRFIYSQRISTGKPNTRGYNMLRHLGTVYSLCEYYKFKPSQATMNAILRSVNYFKNESLGPVDGHDDMLTVWPIGKNDSRDDAAVKLGGAGLALIALATLEEIRPGTTSHDDLRKIADFIIFMQKPDGGFYSRYTPSEGGRDDTWTSLYYPGEAAFGLKKLYTLTGWEPARIAGDKALMYLAKTREGKFPLPPDHWSLIASAWKNDKPFDIADPVTLHALMVARSIVSEIPSDVETDSPEFGCFNSIGLTCPTSARSEGLIAMMKILPPEHPFAEELRVILANSIKFLITSQVRMGSFAGAIPRAIRIRNDIDDADKFNARADEVRIDYVQHAMCAMIEYASLRK